MYDDEYDDEEDIQIRDEEAEAKQASPDEPVSLVLSGYTASRMDELVEQHLKTLVSRAVGSRIDKLVEKAVEDKVAAIADEVARDRFVNELDICLEEGWKRTNTYGESCGGTITLKDRVTTFLEENYQSKQRGEKILRDVIKTKISEQLSAYAEQINERLKAKVDEEIRKRVNADKTIADQLKASVMGLFDVEA